MKAIFSNFEKISYTQAHEKLLLKKYAHIYAKNLGLKKKLGTSQLQMPPLL